MPQDAQGRWYNDNEPLAVGSGSLASATITTTGSSASFATSQLDNINVALVITAASGTSPSLTLTVETTADGTNYYTAGTFPAQTTTTTGVARVVGPLGPLTRYTWTVSGTTPSFTLAITATSSRDD